MPQIYTSIPYSVDSTLPGASNVSDGDPYTYFDQNSFQVQFTGQQTIDRVYAIAGYPGNVSTVLSTSPGSFIEETMTESFNKGTYDNRRALLVSGAEVTTDTMTVTVSAATRVYKVLFMKHLFDLTDTDNRAITSFETSRGARNAFVQEDLYGTTSLQTGHLSSAKKTIQYEIWQSAANITDARNELNKLYQVQRQHPNFTIWDLDEPNAQDYESIFNAHWIPNSFSERIEASQAISYRFTVQQS